MKTSVPSLAAALVLVLSPAMAAAQADFSIAASDNPDPVGGGATVTFSFEVGNVGDGDTTAAVVADVHLPPGVPCDVGDYFDGDPYALDAHDAMSSSFTIEPQIFDIASTSSTFEADAYCEAFDVRWSGLTLGAGVSGAFTFGAAAPRFETRRALLSIAAPNLNQEITTYGRGGCSGPAGSCAGMPCLGARMTTEPAITAPIELADNGAGGSLGCNPLVGFTAGRIALVDRGLCSYETKAVNAEQAGAAGVIIADTNNFTDDTTAPYDIVDMSCVNFCGVIDIPAVFISWAHASALKSDLTGATATMGAVDTGGIMTTDAHIFELGLSVDTNGANDNDTELTTVLFSDPDFSVTMTDDPDPVPAGEAVAYTVYLANASTAYSPSDVYADINLPAGVPADVEAYFDNEVDAIAAFNALDDSIAIDPALIPFGTTAPYVFGADALCEGFMVQLQDLVLPPGAAGTMSYTAVAPTDPARRGLVAISAPHLDQEITAYGRGGCADGNDCTGIPCMGPRLTAFDAITAPVELVDDGGGSEGCSPLVGFTVGNIALIDRGTCSFETKAMAAVDAGAAGLIVADSDDLTDGTVDPYDTIDMGCTNFCSQDVITIPSVLISYAHGVDLKSDLTGATATLGAVPTGDLLFTTATIFELGPAADTNRANDVWTEQTVIDTSPSHTLVFRDGFELGNLSQWSTVTFGRNTRRPLKGELSMY